MPVPEATLDAADEIRANIERFRNMLREGSFALSQRDTLAQMVIEEEAKFAELQRQSVRGT